MYSALIGLLIIPGLFLGMLLFFWFGKAYALWQVNGDVKKAGLDILLVAPVLVELQHDLTITK
jgi:hypothetical protein